MKTLGIDYGTKRVGVAVSYASLAEPLTILENDEHLLREVKKIVNEHKVKRIVVGLSENEMAKKTQAFAESLQNELKLPICFNDETLSSYQVHQFLRLHNLKERQGPIDHLAAAVILQNFLDREFY